MSWEDVRMSGGTVNGTRRVARRGLLAVAGLALALLQGCMIISPVPAFELLKASAGAATSAISTGPSKAQNSVYHEHPTVKQACIEYNPVTPDPDIPPALQAELKLHDIDSRVYEAGGAPASCQFLISYTAHIEWDTTALSDTYRPYLRDLTLTLRDAQGTVLSSSAYALGGAFEMGKWASSRSKVAPVVTALVTGF
jgi:hypothetical protein